LGARPAQERGEAALVGVPFDGTASYRPGSRFGPMAIREGSHSLETFGPYLDRDLTNMDYIDLGDLDVAPGSVERMIEGVAEVVAEIHDREMRPILLGGEHTISIGAVMKMVEYYPDLVVLQLDAHADYRDEYLGESISHATTMRRVTDFISPDRLYRLGVRSGTRDEFIKTGIELPLDHEGGVLDVDRLLKSIPRNAPLYMTLDLDVFDPSLMSGVGNPEPNGLTYREFIHLVHGLIWHKLVGFDVVELAPQYDPSGESAIVAATAVRDLMLCMM